jgi:hypothetical protein
MINQWSLAIRRKTTASQVSSLAHVYPTMSMAGQRAADGFFEVSPVARWASRLSRSYFRWRRRDEAGWNPHRERG